MINKENSNNLCEITTFLLSQKDLAYRDFSAKLIPNIDKESVIGVRTPVLRKFAKEIYGTNNAEDFLCCLPHDYLEQNHLHAFLIEQEKDIEKALMLTNTFLPFVDNWATCDCFRPKIFRKHLDTVYKNILIWIKSDHVYTKRYAIGLLLSFYLDSHFDPMHLKLVSDIKSNEYYINMMIAWYFATAIAKKPQHAIPYIEQQILDTWTHNKTISKACESFRVDEETKSYLKTLRIRNRGITL